MSCCCPPQLGHRVIELPALTSHRIPNFFAEVKVGIAVGYGFPKSESLTHLLETGNFPGHSGLFAEALFLSQGVVWEQVNSCQVKSGGSLLRLPIMEGLEFSIQSWERITESDKIIITEIRIGF